MNRTPPVNVEPKELDRDTLRETLDGPFALLEAIFSVAANSDEFEVSDDVWYGLRQFVRYVQKDFNEILEQDWAFDLQQEARRAVRKGGGAQ